MKFRSVLILGVLFAVLSATMLLFEKNPRDTGKGSEAEMGILSLHSSEISGLTLQLGSDSLVLEKTNNRWELCRPVAMQADKDAVESLLSELEFLTAQRVIQDQPLDLAQYGLERSSKQVRVKTSSGEKVLKLGSRTTVGNGMYVQVEGKPQVFVVAESLGKSLTKNPEDLRNRMVMEFTMDDITQLALTNSAGQFEVVQEKSPAGSSWKWKTPVKGKEVDQNALNSVLWELRALKFKKFLGEQGGSKAIETHPLVKATVTLIGKESPQTLWVGSVLADGSYVCKMEGKPAVFTLESYQVEPMEKDLAKAVSNQYDPNMGHSVPYSPSSK